MRHAALCHFRDAQVADLDLLGRDQEDVLRFDVAMQDVGSVQALETLADLVDVGRLG